MRHHGDDREREFAKEDALAWAVAFAIAALVVFVLVVVPQMLYG